MLQHPSTASIIEWLDTPLPPVADESEVQIVREGGLGPILTGAKNANMELQSQCARALRNLSVNRE